MLYTASTNPGGEITPQTQYLTASMLLLIEYRQWGPGLSTVGCDSKVSAKF